MSWLENRSKLVSDLRGTQLELRPPRRKKHDIDSIRKLRSDFKLLLEEYVENVPLLPVSRCPICDDTLEIAIDLGGLDSPWWWDVCPRDFSPPGACEHFRVFLGALDLHGRQPVEVDTWSVLPGPGAPYIIDRMLSMEGMQAVITELKVGTGDTGYLIAYYSAEPIPTNDLHQEWRRQTWTVYDDNDEPIAKDLVNDPWDFDLAPWLDSGKLLWIDPGDDSLTLKEGKPCPYEALPGTHEDQEIDDGTLELGAAPDGSEPEYYAPY